MSSPPCGIAGKDILLEARIIAVAEAVDVRIQVFEKGEFKIDDENLSSQQ